MKKVAFLTERLKTGFGVDLVVHEQAKRLSKSHKVTIFAIDIEPGYIREAEYTVHRLSIPLFFSPIFQDIVTFCAFVKYVNVLRGFNVFVIHTPTFNAWIPLLSRFGKVVVYHYGNSPSIGYKGFKRYRKNVLDFLENTVYYRFAKEILTISQFLKSKLAIGLQSRTSIIYLGREHIQEIHRKLNLHALDAVRKKYFIKKGDVVISYIGRLDYVNNPYKNTKDLIQVLHEINASQSRLIKIFAIGFPENDIEKKLFKKGICVIPLAKKEDLVGILSLSYIYFSPSLWEGFNLPLIEAQTLGIPVVAYNAGAHSEVVDDGQSGFLIKNAKSASEKIRYLIDNPEKRNRMSKSAIKFARKFSWKQNTAELEKHLW